jgi:hypothetical protein
MMSDKKPTIAELEEILSKEDDYYKVEIKPNGEVIAVTNAEHLESLLVQRDKEIERLGKALSDEQALYKSTRESLRLTYTENEARLEKELVGYRNFIGKEFEKYEPKFKALGNCEAKLSRCYAAGNKLLEITKVVVARKDFWGRLDKRCLPSPSEYDEMKEAITALEEVLKEGKG